MLQIPLVKELPAILLLVILLVAPVILLNCACAAERVAEERPIAPVWSGHPVGFSLLTAGSRQFAAFYDSERRMTVAARDITSSEWKLTRLPEKLGWDSHNFVTMALDSLGFIHLSGNMHGHSLKYYRTTRPMDITAFERVPAMVGSREERCTYPRFLRGARGQLIFTYRDGASGNGDQIFNVYEPRTRTWKRLIDNPLTSGEGRMNAYIHHIRGPDEMFHMCWVWRDTGDCSTNHDLCYARSGDLIDWENTKGEPYVLPITLDTAEIIDPVPAGGGIINGNTVIGFDSRRRPIVSYHKFDAAGNTQLYNARLEDGGWTIYQTSEWNYRWEFQGGGSIRFEISFSPVRIHENGWLAQSFSHPRAGSGTYILDEATLKPVATIGKKSAQSSTARETETGSADTMQPRSAGDLGASGRPGVRYVLRWQTLPPNRDAPRPGPPPAPSMLVVQRLEEYKEGSAK